MTESGNTFVRTAPGVLTTKTVGTYINSNDIAIQVEEPVGICVTLAAVPL